MKKSKKQIDYEQAVYLRHEAMRELKAAREFVINATVHYDASCVVAAKAWIEYTLSKEVEYDKAN